MPVKKTFKKRTFKRFPVSKKKSSYVKKNVYKKVPVQIKGERRLLMLQAMRFAMMTTKQQMEYIIVNKCGYDLSLGTVQEYLELEKEILHRQNEQVDVIEL